jgi:putative pre-16S rRNA nuclease
VTSMHASHTTTRPDGTVGASPPARPGVRGERLLGLDVGDRRVGVAVADPVTGTIRPLATVQRRSVGRDAVVIGRLAEEHGVTGLVVGLPLLPSGAEGEQAGATRAWAEAVATALDVPLVYRDERRTSLAAEARGPRPRRGSGGGAPSAMSTRAHRARVDREAAVLILQAELDARASSSGQTTAAGPR